MEQQNACLKTSARVCSVQSSDVDSFGGWSAVVLLCNELPCNTHMLDRPRQLGVLHKLSSTRFAEQPVARCLLMLALQCRLLALLHAKCCCSAHWHLDGKVQDIQQLRHSEKRF